MLVIIGASAQGREVFSYACDLKIPVKGFLDSRQKILSAFDGYPPVIGDVESYVPAPDDQFLCAIGEPQQREHYVSLLRRKGVYDQQFLTMVHPTASIGRNVSIGPGSIIAPYVVVTCDVHIGIHVLINIHSSISHDCQIGNYSTLSPGCHIAGRCTLGRRVFLGVSASMIPDVVLGDDNVVGGGGVVIASHLKSASVLMGVPAKQKGQGFLGE